MLRIFTNNDDMVWTVESRDVFPSIMLELLHFFLENWFWRHTKLLIFSYFAICYVFKSWCTDNALIYTDHRAKSHIHILYYNFWLTERNRNLILTKNICLIYQDEITTTGDILSRLKKSYQSLKTNDNSETISKLNYSPWAIEYFMFNIVLQLQDRTFFLF